MSRKANCWGNAPIESFFGTLKTELVHQREYISIGMPLGATCLPTSKAITIVSASTLPSATSPPIGQRQCPLKPVSTPPGKLTAMVGRLRRYVLFYIFLSPKPSSCLAEV
jgi:transposase InsO family protein